MENVFCKIDNYNIENKNIDQYILTDKYKQPLQCKNNSCHILNFKQIIDNPLLVNKPNDSLLEDTQIPCTLKNDSNGLVVDSEPIDRSKINFNIYNIASINKDLDIKNIFDTTMTVKEIESKFDLIYLMDKNNLATESHPFAFFVTYSYNPFFV